MSLHFPKSCNLHPHFCFRLCRWKSVMCTFSILFWDPCMHISSCELGGPWGHSYLFLSLSEPVERCAAWWQSWVRGVFSVAPVATDLFFSPSYEITVKDTVRNDVGFCLSCIYMFLSFLYKCHYLCNWLDCICFPSLVGSICWILKNKDKDDLLRKCMLCQNTRLQRLSCVLGDFCLMGSLLATKPPGLNQTVILANMKRKYLQYSNEREIPIGKFTPKPAWFAKEKNGVRETGEMTQGEKFAMYKWDPEFRLSAPC